MAFFDPVDPSTESLLWPGRVGFCIVAQRAVMARLLLWELVGQKGNSLGVHSCLATRLSLRGSRTAPTAAF
jgi:hypothetical protein